MTEPTQDSLEQQLQDAVANDPNVIAAEGGTNVQDTQPPASDAGPDGSTPDVAQDSGSSQGDADQSPNPLDGLGEPGAGCKRWVLTYANGATETVITDAQTAADQCNRTFGLTEEEAAEHGCSVTEG